MMRRKLVALVLTAVALPTMAAKPLTERLGHGKEVYLKTCARCHDTGVDGAPMLSMPDQWSGRSDLWEAVLFEHANQGYGLMPGAGGDPSLQEYDIDAAAEYIMSGIFPECATD
jgi:cytochrome c5